MSFISQTMTRRLLWVLLLGGSAALLTGCVVAPAYPAYGTEVVAGDVYAPAGPASPDQRGDPGAIPSPAYVWIGGSWGLGRRLQLASRPLGHAATSAMAEVGVGGIMVLAAGITAAAIGDRAAEGVR